jgi:hypothetical protein
MTGPEPVEPSPKSHSQRTIAPVTVVEALPSKSTVSAAGPSVVDVVTMSSGATTCASRNHSIQPGAIAQSELPNYSSDNRFFRAGRYKYRLTSGCCHATPVVPNDQPKRSDFRRRSRSYAPRRRVGLRFRRPPGLDRRVADRAGNARPAPRHAWIGDDRRVRRGGAAPATPPSIGVTAADEAAMA